MTKFKLSNSDARSPGISITSKTLDIVVKRLISNFLTCKELVSVKYAANNQKSFFLDHAGNSSPICI